jgi:hypothetical protein
MDQSHTLTVYETRDYDLFKILSGNRALSQSQIKKLANSIAKNPAFTKLSPILVNDRMEVIDGQHRLAAYKKFAEDNGIKHPVYFVISKNIGIAEARSLNAGSKPWSPRDYAVAYADSGNIEYAAYLKYAKSTGLNHDILVRYLAPSNYGLANFRDGGFKVENEKLSRQWFNELEEASLAVKGSMTDPIDTDHRGFAIGLLNVMRSPNYDHQRMLEQLESHSKHLRVVDMKNDEISRTLQRIYNIGREDKQALLD